MTYLIRLVATAATLCSVAALGCSSKGKTVTQETSPGTVAAPSATAASSMLSGAVAPASKLISSLTGSIPGLSQAQAILGAGSIFGLAKAKMPTDQFSQLASAVPGTEALIGEATKAGLPAASQLTGLASLTPLLSKAGISSGTVSQLVSSLAKAVTSAGGASLGEAFTAAVQ